MQHGPYGITSRANIFMAAYSSILLLHLEFDSLKNPSEKLLSDISGKKHDLDIKKKLH
jgi:hypothetical protein